MITVVIPTYKPNEIYLKQAVNSLINQTNKDFKLLIVDDTPGFNFSFIADELNELNAEVVYNDENLGLVRNWNKSISLISQGWIKFLFQDDYLEDNYFEKIIPIVNSNNYEFIITNRNYIFSKNVTNDKKERLSEMRRLSFFFTNEKYISLKDYLCLCDNVSLSNIFGEPSSYVFKKELIIKNGIFCTLLQQKVDFEFVLRNLVCSGFYFMPNAINYFRIHNESESYRNSKFEGALSKRNSDDFIILMMMMFDEKYKPYRQLLKEKGIYRLLEIKFNNYYNKICALLNKKEFDLYIEPLLNLYPETPSKYRYYFRLKYLLKKYFIKNE